MKSHVSCAKKVKKRVTKRTVTHEFIYLFISYKKRKSFNENKFNEPPNPFGCVLVLLSYHKFRNSTIPFAPFELRTFFLYFSQEKKCEEKHKFIDRVKVEKEKKSKTVIKVWGDQQLCRRRRRRKESKPTQVKWRRRHQKWGRRPVLTEIECESAPRA